MSNGSDTAPPFGSAIADRMLAATCPNIGLWVLAMLNSRMNSASSSVIMSA